jgi:hypothetical protein
MEKAIQDYQAYTINEQGEVFSTKWSKKRKLKPQKASQSKTGYVQVRLFNKEYPNGKLHYIHRLVYTHFISDIEPRLQIDHIDGDTLNNNVSNLQMMSGRENKQKYHRETQDVLLRDKRDKLIQDYQTLGTFKKVAEKWGVSLTAVNRVIRNRMHTKLPNGKYGTVVYDKNINDRWSL